MKAIIDRIPAPTRGTDLLICASSAPGRGKWGGYVRLTVLEVTPGATPATASPRARGVVEVHLDRTCHGAGSGPRSAYQQTLAEARTLVQRLASETP